MAKTQTHAIPEGYVMTLFGNGEDAGTVVINGKVNGKTQHLATFYGIRHPYPVTEDALAYAFRDMSHTVTDTDGEEHTVRGVFAAAAKHFQHALESVRGGIRSDLVKGRPISDELAQHRYASALTFGGSTRSGGTRAVATRSELEKLSKEEIIALLQARGAAE